MSLKYAGHWGLKCTWGIHAESAVRFCGRHKPVTASSPPPCAESTSRVCGRHTHVPASSPPPCAESATRICGRHTHVSASSLPPCAENAACVCRRQRNECLLGLYHHHGTMCGERRALRGRHTHVSAPSRPPCADSAALRGRHTHVSASSRNHVQRAMHASAGGTRNPSPPPCEESAARFFDTDVPAPAGGTHICPPRLHYAESAALICSGHTHVSAPPTAYTRA